MDRPRPARILETEVLAREITSITLENKLDADPSPGQFIMVWNGEDEKPMGVASIGQGSLTFLVKAVGPFTRSLRTLGKGDFLGIRGPYGRPFDTSFQRPLLVGGGIGVSPLLYLASQLLKEGHRPEMVIGFNTARDAFYLERFKALGSTSICTDDGSSGRRGSVCDNLPPLDRYDCVFACGPEPMLVSVGRLAEEAGVPAQLLVERYFKCGIGLCGSCSLGRLLVCRDGPVFFWQELKGTEFGAFKRDECGLRNPLT